jgi:hypothetical protein
MDSNALCEDDNAMKKKKEIGRPTPFKRAGVYKDRNAAMKGEYGPQEAKERLADARVKAVELGEKIHKEEI